MAWISFLNIVPDPTEFDGDVERVNGGKRPKITGNVTRGNPSESANDSNIWTRSIGKKEVWYVYNTRAHNSKNSSKHVDLRSRAIPDRPPPQTRRTESMFTRYWSWACSTTAGVRPSPERWRCWTTAGGPWALWTWDTNGPCRRTSDGCPRCRRHPLRNLSRRRGMWMASSGSPVWPPPTIVRRIAGRRTSTGRVAWPRQTTVFPRPWHRHRLATGTGYKIGVPWPRPPSANRNRCRRNRSPPWWRTARSRRTTCGARPPRRPRPHRPSSAA